MPSFHVYFAMLALCLYSVSTPVIADEMAVQGCDAAAIVVGPTYTQGPDCLLSWVDNAQLQAVVWHQVDDDFQEASLQQGVAGVPVLTSGYWPGLVDIDQDGWLDMISFTPTGMVNGTFDIFLFDPNTGQFNQTDPLYGHTLARDRLGYIVTTGRSGPGWVYNFYTMAQGAMTFLLDVTPYGLGQSGARFGDSCDVSLGYQKPLQFDDILAAGQIPDGATFFADYCDLEPDINVGDRMDILQENPATTDRVPDNTVFYCVLDGGTKAVTIVQAPHTLFYAYGPVAGAAELDLSRPVNAVRLRPEISAGMIRSGDITFTNGAYEYVIYYKYDLAGAGRATSQNSGPQNDTLTRGLAVYKDGDTTAPVFQRTCMPDRTYDAVFALPGFR